MIRRKSVQDEYLLRDHCTGDYHFTGEPDIYIFIKRELNAKRVKEWWG